MTLHFFAIPALNPQPAQDKFNCFCRAHRVVKLECHFVSDAANAYWALRVTIAEADSSLPDGLKAKIPLPELMPGRWRACCIRLNRWALYGFSEQ